MNLLTPIAGFLIGYGGIMGYQVIDSTYKGEMPGPKSFGYFIGGMTLLSAATIYALGRTDKVFNAGGLSQFTPNELTQSSAIHGDFDHASLNYSGHQNMILRGESFAVDVIHTKDGIEVGDNSIANEYQCGECDSVYDNSSDATICCKCSSCDEPIHEGDCIKYAETFNVEFDADGNYNDFIEDMEGVMGKYGEMKDFDSGYNPKNNLLKARMVVEVDDEDFDNVDFDAESFYDNFGDMEYILLNMLTDEQLEEEYGDFMRDEGVGRKELPQRLQDRYRTDEEAEYLREKYLEPEDFDAEYDFQNQAVTTIIADEEDEAYETFARTYDPQTEDWEIIDVRDAEGGESFLSENDYEKVELVKPIRTGWSLGAGIALFSVTATLVAATLTIPLLGKIKGE